MIQFDYSSSESLAPVIEALLFASDEPLSGQDLRSLILGEELARGVEVDEDPDESTASDATSPGTERGVEEVAELVSPEATNPVTEDDIPETTSSKGTRKRKRKQLIELPVIHGAIEMLNAGYDSTERAFRVVQIAGGYQFATRSDFAPFVARLFKEKSRRRLSGAALESLAIIAYKQPVSKMDVENIRGVNCDEVLKSLLEKNLITITGRAEAVGRPLLYGTTEEFLRHFGLHSISDLPKPREIEELMKEEAVKATTLDEAAEEFVSDQGEGRITLDDALIAAKDLARREEEADEPIGIELAGEVIESEAANESESEEASSPEGEEEAEDDNATSDQSESSSVEAEEEEATSTV